MDRKKLFIMSEAVIVSVYIICYWGFDAGLFLSLVACVPIAAISIYLLVRNPSEPR